MRGKKLSLDALAVESFETAKAMEEERGTVRGLAAGCTCKNTCLCRTAYYQCGTGPFTIYSCDYTQNEYCPVWTWDGGCATPPSSTCP